ncbi:GAF domain-containing protein [candidate division KSB1 bacterium]|nr:GAF domain-containing protein [candidate division KSB1 bacterium]
MGSIERAGIVPKKGELMRDKTKLFHSLLNSVTETVNGPRDKNEKLNVICKLLKDKVPYYDWVGFYLVCESKRELILGPFAGEPTEHVRIPFGDGICGQAAERKKPFIVQDVSKEINYLACSVKVKSEIVIPIFKNEGIIGELDIDSHTLSPFTEEDRRFLENVCKMVSELF